MKKIPTRIIDRFDEAASGLEYGSVTLSLFLRSGKRRFVISREESIFVDDKSEPRTVKVCQQAPDMMEPRIHRYTLDTLGLFF